MAVRKLASKAVTRWQEDGFITLLAVASSRLRRRANRFRVRRNYGYISDGADVIDVAPEWITHFLIEGNHPATSYRTRKSLMTKHELSKAYFPIEFYRGAVVPGDWDEHAKPHRFDRVYRALKRHYVDGVDWTETEYVQHMLLLDDLYDVSYVERRIGRCEALYRSIGRNGYENAPDPLHNVPVNIGRDGELIFNNKAGHHRLALAKILAVDHIPVVVVVRHEEWQAFREETAAAESIDELDDRAREHLDHPDVRSLHDFDGKEGRSNPLTELFRFPVELLTDR